MVSPGFREVEQVGAAQALAAIATPLADFQTEPIAEAAFLPLDEGFAELADVGPVAPAAASVAYDPIAEDAAADGEAEDAAFAELGELLV